MKGLSATAIVIFSVLVLVSASTSQFAFSDGGGPLECEVGPTDDSGNNPTIINVGTIIVAVCIKSGNEAIGDEKHSGLIITDATIENCFVVDGLGTQTVTVTETGNAGCKEISHVDFFIDDMVGGHGGITDNAALLVSGSHLTASWMIPLLVSAIGIGVFVVTRK